MRFTKQWHWQNNTFQGWWIYSDVSHLSPYSSDTGDSKDMLYDVQSYLHMTSNNSLLFNVKCWCLPCHGYAKYTASDSRPKAYPPCIYLLQRIRMEGTKKQERRELFICCDAEAMLIERLVAKWNRVPVFWENMSIRWTSNCLTAFCAACND